MDELTKVDQVNQMLNSFALTPILEFAAIAFLVIVTYLAIHNLNAHWHNLVKFSIAILFGTMGYVVGKFAIILLLVSPLLTFAL